MAILPSAYCQICNFSSPGHSQACDGLACVHAHTFSPALEKLRYSRHIRQQLLSLSQRGGCEPQALIFLVKPALGPGMVAASLSLGLGHFDKHRGAWMTLWAVPNPLQPYTAHHCPFFCHCCTHFCSPQCFSISLSLPSTSLALLLSLLPLSFPPSPREVGMENQGSKRQLF